METHILEVRPDFERDPAGAHLDRLLDSQRALAHARARRDFLARATAVFVGFLVATVAVAWWARRLRDAEREIEIRRGRTT